MDKSAPPGAQEMSSDSAGDQKLPGRAGLARGKVVALLDDLALTAGDTAYPTIVTLRSDVMRAIPGSRALARVITIELREPIPVDVLAYRLYGSVDLADDIIARNKIRHPLFVSGVLKVLSNGN